MVYVHSSFHPFREALIVDMLAAMGYHLHTPNSWRSMEPAMPGAMWP